MKSLRRFLLLVMVMSLPLCVLAADKTDSPSFNSPLNAGPKPISQEIGQIAKLTPANGSVDLGTSVAIDGNVVVVGAKGAAYVYVKPLNGWQDMTQTATLSPSIGINGFGTSVAISGNIILVGAPGANDGELGKVFAYVKPSRGWKNMTETAQLVPSDGAPNDDFGISVSISGGTAVVGADQLLMPGNGAAYVFTAPKKDWSTLAGITLTETAKLVASNGAIGAAFGSGVAISTKIVAVGAADANEAYVFVKPPGGWNNMTETAQLMPSDAGGFLGEYISTNGDTIVAGAPFAGQNERRITGAAYVFVEPAGGWTDITETAQLLPSTNPGTMNGPVTIDTTGHYIGAGSPFGYGNGDQSGQVYLFFKPSGGWRTTAMSQKIFSSDGEFEDSFGVSVGISGQTLVAGAPGAHVGNQRPGAGYVFGSK